MRRPGSLHIIGIVTNRDYVSWPSWHIVHEWEDAFADELDVPLLKLKRKTFAEKVIGRMIDLGPYRIIRDGWERFRRLEGYTLAFHMTPANFVRRGEIPIIIDFAQTQDLKRFYSAYADCALVLISSMEVFRYLKERSCPLNIHHLALSLPDRLKLSHLPRKEFDVIFPGRSSEPFISYMRRLTHEEPDIEYVFRKEIREGEMRYVSSKRGELGEFAARKDYLALLKRCRVALYTSPGSGGEADRLGGFSPVTPRLLECLACGCVVVGRYTDNADFAYYGVGEVVENIVSYQQFKHSVLEGLRAGEGCQVDARYESFLDRHVTSKRARRLRVIMQQECD